MVRNLVLCSCILLFCGLLLAQPVSAVPVVQFSGIPLSGPVPLTVTFTDASSGNEISAWSWEFGDGGTSTEKDPSHEYTTTGSFSVNLTVTDADGVSFNLKPGYITVTPPAPVADFSGTPRSGPAPLTVTFSDLSTNTPTSWKWEYQIGGGGWTQFATIKNPSFAFPTGTYDIRLTATNAGGSDVMEKGGYITVTPPAPVADFSGTPRSGANPLTVTFTDLSTNTPTSWKWEYQNGTVTWTQFATIKNPSFVFPSGTYDIRLTATNAGGSTTATQTAYIVVNPPPPVADYSAVPLSGDGPLTVTFTDLSTNSPTSWRWAYRNATVGWTQFSVAKNPVFTFPVGSYSINLTATNAGGSDDLVRNGYITALLPPPVADFSASPLSGPDPLEVTFTDLSTNSPDQWSWEYRNGTVGWTQFATTRNPVFSFRVGTYDIRLTATNTAGSNVVTQTGYITVSPLPIPLPDFSATPLTGVGPLTVAFSDLSTNGPTSWNWTFGDGNTSGNTLQNPVHTYLAAGLYTVTLNATNAYGSAEASKIHYINVTRVPERVGIYRASSGMFYLRSGSGSSWSTKAVGWGLPTDLPVSGDWNGDDITEVGVYRPLAHSFYLRNGTTSWTTRTLDWGVSSDLPVSGDWNGDGITDVGVFRRLPHLFYLRNGTTTWKTTVVNWGIVSDLPVTGDWNGDGVTEVGVFRPFTHTFYLRNAGYPDTYPTLINWGQPTDLPVSGDWDADGRDEIGVYRPSTHTFYLRNSGYPSVPATIINWGISTDLPVTGIW